MKLYMAVTADKYELPLVVADSAMELARCLNRNVQSIYQELSPSRRYRLAFAGKYRGYRLIKLDVEEEEK